MGLYQDHGLSYAVGFIRGKVQRKLKLLLGASYYQPLNAKQLNELKEHIRLFESKPLFSVIMPVYNVEEKWLVKAIESVRNQIYPYWELCITDDASPSPHIKQVLQQYESTDKRIKVVYRSQSGNIAEASNDAAAIATGDFLTFLDHDDELAPEALYENALLLQSNADAEWIYSDEDKIDEKGNHFSPDFKPAWSPELLNTCMYTTHLTVIKTTLFKKTGGFRTAYNGAQDYDLALRLAKLTSHIYHIPKVLYHWRTIRQSTASVPTAKLYAFEAGRKALQDFLQTKAKVTNTPYYGLYHIDWEFTSTPLVSIVIPTAGRSSQVMGRGNICLIEHCIQSIRNTCSYQPIEIVVVDGKDVDPELKNKLIGYGAKWVSCEPPFNFSNRINKGVEASSGEYVVLLNDDTEMTDSNWLSQMLAVAMQDKVGAVGVKLITPANQVQHAGIVMFDGSPAHVLYGKPDIGQGYHNMLVANRNYLAVTAACLMVKKSVYQEVGGMDESFPVNFNDVDFCLKLHQKGYRNVCLSEVKLYHFESVTRQTGYTEKELTRFVEKWKNYPPAHNDPYYNPNLLANPALLG